MHCVVASVNLHGPGRGIGAVRVVRAEAPDVCSPQVEGGPSLDDPFRHRLPHAATGGDPRCAPCNIETAHLCRLAQQEVPVGGEDLRTDHQFSDPHVVERGNADGRAASQGLEVVPVRHHLGRIQIGRDRFWAAGHGIPFVPAHQQAADFLAAVHPQVLIAKRGQISRHPKGHRHHVMVLDGDNGDGDPDDAADVPGPHSRRAHHHGGADRTLRGGHGVYTAIAHADAGYTRLRVDFTSTAAPAARQGIGEAGGGQTGGGGGWAPPPVSCPLPPNPMSRQPRGGGWWAMLQPPTPPPMMTAWASSRMLHRIRDALCSTPCEIEEVRPSRRREASAGRRNVPDVDHSSPAAEIVEEARRVTAAAQQEQIALKLTGGLGIYFHAPSARAGPFRREYRDLDLVGLSAQRVAVQPFLARLGYKPDTPFNTLQGRRRLRYWDRTHDRPVDIFLDQIWMCHTIDLRDRLHEPEGVLTPADLLLTKMQIVKLNAKDLTDIVALLLDHTVGAADGEDINAAYVARLLARDWGFYRTLQLNMDRIRTALARLPAQTDAVGSHLAALWQAVEMHPKSLSWRLRARIGDRLPWYELPEPDEAG